MKVVDLLRGLDADPLAFQLALNDLVDEFREAAPRARPEMVAAGSVSPGERQGLLAAVVDALCRETGTPLPEWARETYSPRPTFAFGAKGFALRLRLMLESPPPFRIRNVFVPENFLHRA